MTKNKFKKYSEKVKKDFKGLSKKYKTYAPIVKKRARQTNRFLAGTAEAISSSLTPRKGYVDLTVKHKPTRVRRVDGGFYLDYTK